MNRPIPVHYAGRLVPVRPMGRKRLKRALARVTRMLPAFLALVRAVDQQRSDLILARFDEIALHVDELSAFLCAATGLDRGVIGDGYLPDVHRLLVAVIKANPELVDQIAQAMPRLVNEALPDAIGRELLRIQPATDSTH